MKNQSFIYDGDGKGLIQKTFIVKSPTIIRSAGLTECVTIYTMVGDCLDCQPDDILWSPVITCGEPLELCPENPSVVLTIPGTYAVGNPADDPQLLDLGDVNITKQDGVDPSLLGKHVPCNQDVTVTNTCDNPVTVELCPGNFGIETAMTNLGCIVDEDGELIGKVILCKTTDEETLVETVTMTAYYEDGSVVENYSGPWQTCEPDKCVPEDFIGVITDLSALR